MRDRLYINTVQKMLSATSKVVVNVKKGNPFVYLPLDKITEATAQGPSKASVAEEAFKAANISPSDNTFHDPLRPVRPEQQDRVGRGDTP
jgi:membrane protease subunit HflK